MLDLMDSLPDVETPCDAREREAREKAAGLPS